MTHCNDVAPTREIVNVDGQDGADSVTVDLDTPGTRDWIVSVHDSGIPVSNGAAATS